MSIPTSADDIHHEIALRILNSRFECPFSQNLSSSHKRLGPSLHAMDVQRREEGADLCGEEGVRCEEVVQGYFEIIGREVFGGLDQLV